MEEKPLTTTVPKITTKLARIVAVEAIISTLKMFSSIFLLSIIGCSSALA
jgi:hypothetical protein